MQENQLLFSLNIHVYSIPGGGVLRGHADHLRGHPDHIFFFIFISHFTFHLSGQEALIFFGSLTRDPSSICNTAYTLSQQMLLAQY